MTSVQTALSSHSACFICRERHRSLHRIKKKDVIHAYKSHKIYINEFIYLKYRYIKRAKKLQNALLRSDLDIRLLLKIKIKNNIIQSKM